MFRFIVDLTFLFPFSENFKRDSQENDDFLWPSFIFIYLIIGDLIPTFLLLRVFVTHTKHSNTNTVMEVQNDLSIYHQLTDPKDSFDTSHPLTVSENQKKTVGKTLMLLTTCPKLLKGTENFSGSNLQKYKVVALFFSSS